MFEVRTGEPTHELCVTRVDCGEQPTVLGRGRAEHVLLCQHLQAVQAGLIALAESHGITILSGCRTGQCESCEVAVLSGAVGYLNPEADPGDDGRCLTCQAVPISDLAIDA